MAAETVTPQSSVKKVEVCDLGVLYESVDSHSTSRESSTDHPSEAITKYQKVESTDKLQITHVQGALEIIAVLERSVACTPRVYQELLLTAT